jgi:hypothetical protein
MGSMKVEILGGQAQQRRKPCNFVVWTYDKVVRFVESRGFSPKVAAGVIKILNGYPMGAYDHFVKNIDRLVQRVQHEIFMTED